MSAPSGGIVPQLGPNVGQVVDRVRGQSGARILALMLIVAIIVLRAYFSGRLPLTWGALWGPIKPLGLGHTTVSVPTVSTQAATQTVSQQQTLH